MTLCPGELSLHKTNAWLPTGFQCQSGHECTQSGVKVLWPGHNVFQCRGGALHFPPGPDRAPWTTDLCGTGELARTVVETKLFPQKSLLSSSQSYISVIFRSKVIHLKKNPQKRKQRKNRLQANPARSVLPLEQRIASGCQRNTINEMMGRCSSKHY